MTPSNKIQKILVLITAPVVAFLCYLIGEQYTTYASYTFYGNTIDRFVTLKIILGSISILGWVLIYLTTKLLKAKIVLRQILYYWIMVILISILLLIMQGISTIS